MRVGEQWYYYAILNYPGQQVIAGPYLALESVDFEGRIVSVRTNVLSKAAELIREKYICL